WADLRILVCVRNPLEVAQSLLDRDEFPYLAGLRLWRAYYGILLQSVPLERCVVTTYAAYFVDAAAELRRVCDAIGLPAKETNLSTAIATVAPQLRHTRVASAELADLPLPEGVADLFRTLRNAAGPIAARESAATSDPLSPRLLGQILRIEEGLVRQ